MKQQIQFPDEQTVLNLGQGTWRLGEDSSKHDQEITALRSGIDSGLTLIDTAEMYGEGQSEKLVGEAIANYNREDLFLVSKVCPHHAGKSDIFDACDQTLERLGVETLDLYLLHWRGRVPLQETVDCFEDLKRQGKIKNWGVSNFDLEDMQELLAIEGGENCQTNQVLYHLASRGTEVVLQDYLKEKGIPMMAYCPVIGQEPNLKERVYNDATVKNIADAHDISIIQLLLAFVMQQDNVIAIPKASSKEHVQLNADVLDVTLSEEEINQLDAAFPVPDHRVPLSIQ
ncbi:aldo/keto reductase [Marinilactibacillus sp. Marseille-P9653]|uniref:aldo/keto reductase n=1 Tax=Marinilactibacillus sp. Marseille-P9653 TaxID=2866583 RepID=UPI001CE46947|nr:aldo/keto reductase [Marinilactibacillus sp. Marseille-P9653]